MNENSWENEEIQNQNQNQPTGFIPEQPQQPTGFTAEQPQPVQQNLEEMRENVSSGGQSYSYGTG